MRIGVKSFSEHFSPTSTYHIHICVYVCTCIYVFYLRWPHKVPSCPFFIIFINYKNDVLLCFHNFIQILVTLLSYHFLSLLLRVDCFCGNSLPCWRVLFFEFSSFLFSGLLGFHFNIWNRIPRQWHIQHKIWKKPSPSFD